MLNTLMHFEYIRSFFMAKMEHFVDCLCELTSATEIQLDFIFVVQARHACVFIEFTQLALRNHMQLPEPFF